MPRHKKKKVKKTRPTVFPSAPANDRDTASAVGIPPPQLAQAPQDDQPAIEEKGSAEAQRMDDNLPPPDFRIRYIPPDPYCRIIFERLEALEVQRARGWGWSENGPRTLEEVAEDKRLQERVSAAYMELQLWEEARPRGPPEERAAAPKRQPVAPPSYSEASHAAGGDARTARFSPPRWSITDMAAPLGPGLDGERRPREREAAAAPAAVAQQTKLEKAQSKMKLLLELARQCVELDRGLQSLGCEGEERAETSGPALVDADRPGDGDSGCADEASESETVVG